MGPISPLLLWLVLEGGSLWARLHQTEPLGSTARRSHCRCLPLLLRFVSQMGVLLYDSPIYQLTETVKLDHCQAILELTTEPLPEARLLLLISIHVVSHILGQGVESLRVLQHTVVALLQGQELGELPPNHPAGIWCALKASLN